MIARNSRAADLAAVSDVARSALGAHDCDTLCLRICASIARSLGFDRVMLIRDSGEERGLELLAAQGLAAPKATVWVQGAGGVLCRRARLSGLPALVRRRSPSAHPRVAREMGIGIDQTRTNPSAGRVLAGESRACGRSAGSGDRTLA